IVASARATDRANRASSPVAVGTFLKAALPVVGTANTQMPAPQPRLKKRRVMFSGFMLGSMRVAFRGTVNQPAFADAGAASRGCQCNLHAMGCRFPASQS